MRAPAEIAGAPAERSARLTGVEAGKPRVRAGHRRGATRAVAAAALNALWRLRRTGGAS